MCGASSVSYLYRATSQMVKSAFGDGNRLLILLRWECMATTLTLRAVYLAEALDLDRALSLIEAATVRRLRNRTIYELGEHQFIACYSFGVAVLLGVDRKEEARLLKKIRPALHHPEPKGWVDSHAVTMDPDAPVVGDATFDAIRIRALTPDDLDIICRVLAQSVAITQFDIDVDRMIAKQRNVYHDLRRTGQLRTKPRELLRLIGANHEIIRAIITDLALLNAPARTWDDPRLERFWSVLREHFDLDDRFERLEFKLGHLRESTGELLTVVQARRAEILEVAVIALFVIDLALLFYDIITKH